MLEATQKKVKFLNEARAALSLDNVAVLVGRAEERGAQEPYRETMSVAVSRALASLSVVLEYCAPFVRVGGAVVSMKGRMSAGELTAGNVAASKLGLVLREEIPVTLERPLERVERRLVVYEKVRETPASFPRRVGVAKKRPLGGFA